MRSQQTVVGVAVSRNRDRATADGLSRSSDSKDGAKRRGRRSDRRACRYSKQRAVVGDSVRTDVPLDADLRWRVAVREPARGERPACPRTMNHVVTVWMIVCIQHSTIGVRGSVVMVQHQVQVPVRRTQGEMMRSVSHRQQRKRPRRPARPPHREQQDHHEWHAATHRGVDTLRLDLGQPLPLTWPRRGT